MSSVTEQVRMSHRNDPETSREAAVKASRGSKKNRLYLAIAAALDLYGPLTPGEVFVKLAGSGAFQKLDVYDVRRRMSEMEHSLDRIEPNGERREGQRVMRLVGGA